LLTTGAEIALAHHEKFDGSGYPNGLVGEKIPLFARIVAVADVFDALTSERPYKKAWNNEDALAHLRDGSGLHFDPLCVDAFFAGLDRILAVKNLYKDD
jgi:putative two-component system response regulator